MQLKMFCQFNLLKFKYKTFGFIRIGILSSYLNHCLRDQNIAGFISSYIYK